MIFTGFPDLQWLKKQAEDRFANRKAFDGTPLTHMGWPTVILNIKAGETFRDNIPGPLSLFSTVQGKSIVHVNGRETVVNEDYFFLSNNRQRYTLEIEKSAPSEVFNIHFGQNWMEEALSSLTAKTDALLSQPDAISQPVEFFNKLYVKDEYVKWSQQQLLATKGQPLREQELLFDLMKYLLTQNHLSRQRITDLTSIKSSTREELIRRLYFATDYIYSFYHQDILLEDLASASCMSKFHFLRLFKQIFNQTPHQFVLDVRIAKGTALLKQKQLDVKTVARAVGFKDASSFSRAFYQKKRMYPSQFASAV